MDLKEILGEELFNQVAAKLGDRKIDVVNDGSWIPVDKFNQVNEAGKELRKQLEERDSQLKGLEEKAKGNEDLMSEIKSLKAKNDETVKAYEERIKKNEFNYNLENKLRAAKVRNVKAVKALINQEEIKVDEKGNLSGLDEQLEALRKSDSYLFEGKGSVSGREPNRTGSSSSGFNPFTTEHYNLTEQGKIFKENPDLAKKLMQEAGLK